MNKVELEGRLGKDPELRYTQHGKAVATLNLATSDRPKKGEKYGASQWHRVILWGDLAEGVAREARKGSIVRVNNGKIEYRTWEDKSGNKRYSTEIIGFDAEVIPARPRQDSEREFAKANDDTFKGDGNDTVYDDDGEIPF